MMSIYDERNGPMIPRERECCAVMGVWFFTARVIIASFDCRHASLENTFSFAYVMKESGKLSVAGCTKRTSKIFRELRNPNEVTDKRLLRVREEWSGCHIFITISG
ncbi:MAG TPA: hypothetical protein VEH04_03020 [Verrucomicrobiae bacterium]|nr:hypothetical protein [Verrucomicrobiae bacterium]